MPSAKPAAASWRCPKCKRSFTRANQRHACGTGDRKQVLRNRSPELVELYGAIERFAKALGAVEVVARERYVLFRSVRIFTDLVMMTDAVRIAIHLGRRVDEPLFFKIVSDRNAVTHVAKLKSAADFDAVKALIQEAYRLSKAR